MSHLLLITALHIILIAVFLSLILRIFGTTFSFTDALLAAVVAALISLIPMVGHALSILGIIAVVHWRATDVTMSVLLLASLLSRLIAGGLVYKLI